MYWLTAVMTRKGRKQRMKLPTRMRVVMMALLPFFVGLALLVLAFESKIFLQKEEGVNTVG